MKKPTKRPLWRQIRPGLLRCLAGLLIGVVCLLNLAWSGSFDGAASQLHQQDSAGVSQVTATQTPQATRLQPGTPTPLEIEENRYQTEGILVFGAAIVMVIVVGTFGALRRKS
jgi:hypothetical protein